MSKDRFSYSDFAKKERKREQNRKKKKETGSVRLSDLPCVTG